MLPRRPLFCFSAASSPGAVLKGSVVSFLSVRYLACSHWPGVLFIVHFLPSVLFLSFPFSSSFFPLSLTVYFILSFLLIVSLLSFLQRVFPPLVVTSDTLILSHGWIMTRSGSVRVILQQPTDRSIIAPHTMFIVVVHVDKNVSR